MLDLLIVSNGHGEDAIAAHLAQALVRRRPHVRVGGFALVGPGYAYQRAGIPLLFGSRPMPSGGFGWQHPRGFLQDLAAGFLSLTASQLDALRRLRPKVRGLLLVGDIYPVLLTLSYRVPRVFVSTARSDYISPHLRIETGLLARSCQLVLARDELTARSLVRRGVNALSVGNVMMDMLKPRGFTLGLEPGEPVLALLPGSRRDFADNLVALAGVARAVKAERPVQAVAALAGSLPAPARLSGNWRLEPVGCCAEQAEGLDGWLVSGAGDVRIGLTLNGFADLLQRADLALGLAGTANEQAAGLGKPVVSFPRPGVQYTRRFAERQKRLLGDALVLTSGPGEAARQVVRLLDDPEERRRRGEAGRSRMGPPGAADRMVALIERAFGFCPDCPALFQRS